MAIKASPEWFIPSSHISVSTAVEMRAQNTHPGFVDSSRSCRPRCLYPSLVIKSRSLSALPVIDAHLRQSFAGHETKEGFQLTHTRLVRGLILKPGKLAIVIKSKYHFCTRILRSVNQASDWQLWPRRPPPRRRRPS